MQFPFFAKKEHQFLYTLLISKRSVGACVWHVENGSILVDGISDLMIWNEEKNNSLFEAADKAIGSIGDVNATQVLLSLPDDWVQGQGIHTKRKGLLRDLTEKLELSSVGFVVTMEAVVAHLKEASSGPLNLVVSCVEPDAFIMAIVTQSQSSPILRIGRSDKVTDDFLEGCSRLKISGVPPEMSIISMSESEHVLSVMKQELESYTWDSNIFVQTPTIRLESPAFVLTAVTQAGGTEILKALPELQREDRQDDVPVEAPDFVTVHNGVPEQPEQTSLPAVHLDAHTGEEETRQLRTRSNVVLPLLVVVFIAVLIGGYFLLLPKVLHATVEIHRKSTELAGSATVTISPEEDATSSASIRGALLALAEPGEIEVPTTGQKKTGENASGTVSVYNLTSAVKQFKSGTQLKSGKLSFETTEDVSVASASSGANYEKIPGKTNVKIKALAPGEEGNLAKNSEFSVAGYDSSAFIARSESTLSGGTSRTVASVTQKDIDTATTQLISGLKSKINEDLQAKITEGQDGFLLGDISTSGRKSGKSVGEEASSVSVSMNASASALLYNKLDAIEAVAQTLDTSIPVGAKIDQSAVQVDRSDVKKRTADSATVTMSVKGKITLPVDSAKFASILAGKTIEDARTFLGSQSSVDTYTLKVTPSFLTAFMRSLPKDASKVIITVAQ